MCLWTLPRSSESEPVKFDSELFDFEAERPDVSPDSSVGIATLLVPCWRSIGRDHVNMPS